MPDPVLRIAVPSPLHRSFDYRPPRSCDPATLRPGIRVRVPFGSGRRIGILIEAGTQSAIDRHRLKRVLEVLDAAPVLTEDVLAMSLWASAYYHCPVGEALATALPSLLRRGSPVPGDGITGWRLSPAGRLVEPATLQRAPRQRATLEKLGAHHRGLPRPALEVPAAVLATLEAKGWIEPCKLDQPERCTPQPAEPAHVLNDAQQAAVERLHADCGRFSAFLLEGVTGSGKTEVYLQAIAPLIEQRRQTLILVPEIGLTPQLVDRFRRRFDVPLAVLHSGLGDRERLLAWRQSGTGEALIIIGTRSAIFTPLRHPGLLIVDEEHDASLKQQEGFRYSARDLAVWRARRLAIPVLLGSATPSLESLFNVEQRRYRHLRLPNRTGAAGLPEYEVLDIRRQPLEHGLSPPLLQRIAHHLAGDGQVLLFLNRRGFSPTLVCHDCGWIAECPRCDARMTWHQQERRLRCHHCGNERPLATACPECGSTELRPVGHGTERIEQALATHFPDVPRLRIDRDTTRRRGELVERLEQARSGAARLLLGTQMLAKGHHFPNVTLVGIVNADQGLFGSDFRASEHMAQLIVQVAGRAGRHNRPGRVVIQTYHPDHPLLQLLTTRGYPAFARAALAERAAAGLPPATHIALIRAEATQQALPGSFLETVRERAVTLGAAQVEVWGPIPAAMERRAGRFRAQLLLQAGERGSLQRLLGRLVRELEQAKAARRVRWSVDVDPADMF